MPKRPTLTERRMQAFCWGCLFHFLGHDDRALNFLEQVQGNRGLERRLANMARSIEKYIEKCEQNSPERRDALVEVKREADHILQKRLAPLGILSAEGKRRKPSGFLKTAVGADAVGKLRGYSRDPFKPVRDERVLGEIAFGSVLYILRGYSRMFGTSKSDRDFNRAKKSLNDCYQAHQFIWRVYQSSSFRHHHGDNAREYIASGVLGDIDSWPEAGDNTGQCPSPHKSPYFVWGILTMIDIMRGNIYYHTEFFDNADIFYTNALRRVNRASVNNMPLAKAQLVNTWTVVRARFERSKIRFDRGRLLKSMVEQLECLKTIATLNSLDAVVPQSDTVRKMKKAIEFLKVEKDAPFWDKRPICRIFDFGNLEYFSALGNDADTAELELTLGCIDFSQYWRNEDVLRPAEILKQIGIPKQSHNLANLDNRNQRLVADILARMAFTLLILRIEVDGVKVLRTGYLYQWLKEFLRPPGIRRGNYSPMAIYCRTIADRRFPQRRSKKVPFKDYVERQFSLRLREFIASEQLKSDCAYKEYINLLDASTHNIVNLVTIPRRNQRLLMRHGYFHRCAAGDLKKEPENKIVVLRRWQSYNPKLPRPDSHRLRGGGYFLLWQGKGIVIDPGYDFIQNLYEEGFSLEDVHAVIVSHSHPDHDDDLSTLLTMFHEWHEYQKKNGQPQYMGRKIDLFLNESCFRKFTTWVHSEKKLLGRIVPLPQVVWHKNSEQAFIKDADDTERIGPRRGENVIIDLTGIDGYNMKLEVVPAWHDDVLNSTGAAGFVFHLCPKGSQDPVCKLGYTGDTGAYGLSNEGAHNTPLEGNVTQQYADCDVLIAHLGDARLREISTSIMDHVRPREPLPMERLLKDWFCERSSGKIEFDQDRLTSRRVQDFLHLLISVNLVHGDFYDKNIPVTYHGRAKAEYTIIELIREWSDDDEEKRKMRITQDSLWEVLEDLYDRMSVHDPEDDHDRRIVADCRSLVRRSVRAIKKRTRTSPYTLKEAAFLLLAVLCSSCRIPWSYKYHLGITGVENLFKEMYASTRRRRRRRSKAIQGVFVVGELPEELSSYRHRIARWLNTDVVEKVDRRPDDSHKPRFIKAFTGDIGLHIRLERDGKFSPGIRCDYCNLNNEIVAGRDAYLPPRKIRETVVNALDSKMIYLCTEKDHHPDFFENSYYVHLFRPEVKRI